MGGRPSRAARRAASAFIAVAAIAALGVGAHRDGQVIDMFTKPQAVHQQSTDVLAEQCLYQAIRGRVPKGAPVYTQDGYYTQRLAELSTLWAVPVPTLAQARYRLAVVPAHGHCYGLALEVTPV
jgi:hypothetical protein